MPKHEIEMSLPAQTVNNADAEFTVRSNGKKIGKLKISRGTIDWMPVHNSRTHYKMNWERFDQLMQQEGRQVTLTIPPQTGHLE